MRSFHKDVTIFRRICCGIIAIALAAVTTACSPNSSSGSLGGDGANSGGGASVNNGCSSANLTQSSSTSNGAISFRLASNTDPCSVDGYVVGSSGSSGVTNNGDGTYVISGASEGEQDIIITGTSSNQTTSDGSTKPNDVGGSNLQSLGNNTGIRINSLRSDIPVQTFRLSPFGTMAGVVKLSGATDHTGIDVYIPGTSYNAKTDAAGHYRIDSVPPGIHNLRFEFSGYGSATVAELTVQSDATLNVTPVTLYTGAGEGRILILDEDDQPLLSGTPVVSSRVVRYAAQVSGTPRLMKISEDGNFANTAWQPFQSVGRYTFKDFGSIAGGRTTKRLSMRTSDGVTEGDIEVAVVIELFSEIRGKDVLTVDNRDAHNETALQIRIRSTLAANAREMRYSTRADFVGASWLSAEPTKYLPVKAEGDYPVFVQFRTGELVESDVYSAIAQVRIFPAGSVSFTVQNPTGTFPLLAAFNINNIASPRSTGDVKIKFYADTETSPLSEHDLSANVIINPPDFKAICGVKKLTMRVFYKAPVDGDVAEFASEPFSRSVNYECSTPVPNLPGQRIEEYAIATGNNKVFVWGGLAAGTNLESFSGYVWNAVSKGYEKISTRNQPDPRAYAKAWHVGGDKFLIFGGKVSGDFAYNGGIYDHATGEWTRIPSPTLQDSYCGETFEEQFDGSPFLHLIGDYLLMWGNSDSGEYYCGSDPAVGYIYRISTGTWTDMNPTNFPAIPCNRSKYLQESPAIMGDKLFVWSGLECKYEETVHSGGSVFDPAANTWTPVSAVDAPADRFDYLTAWTGTELMVWGGRYLDHDENTLYDGMNSGALYNPATNSWRPMAPAPFSLNYISSSHGLPVLPGTHIGVAGNTIAIFAGFQATSRSWDGLLYNHVTNTWKYMPTLGQPHFSGYVQEHLDDTRPNPYSETFDFSAHVNGKLFVWTRAATEGTLFSNAVLSAVYSIADEKWTSLTVFDRSFNELEVHPNLRNYPRVLPLGDSVLLFGGYKPYSTNTVPANKSPLNDGVIFKLP